MHIFIDELNSRYQSSFNKVFKRRQQWNAFADRAYEMFTDFKKDADNAGFFESINFHRSDPALTINNNYLHFWGGKKFTGISSTTKTSVVDDKGRSGVKTTMEGIIEDSGCLTIGQAPNGNVFFMLFPCESKASSWIDKYIVYKKFNQPDDITYNDVKKAVEFYLKFMLFTSFCAEPSLSEKVQLWWLKFRFSEQWYSIFKGASTVAKLSMGILN